MHLTLPHATHLNMIAHAAMLAPRENLTMTTLGMQICDTNAKVAKFKVTET